eukprot:99938-Alexandrium_andersonii.AAC.1
MHSDVARTYCCVGEGVFDPPQQRCSLQCELVELPLLGPDNSSVWTARPERARKMRSCEG